MTALESVEVKCLFDRDDGVHAEPVLRAARAPATPKKRMKVFLLDTPERSLHARGVVLRIRLRDDERSDVTLKVLGHRPDASWPSTATVEGDRVLGRHNVEALALTTPRTAAEIAAVVEGREEASSLFVDPAGAMLGQVRWSDLVVLGPIDVCSWTVALADVDDELTCETWAFGDHGRLVEVSRKVPASAVDALVGRLESFLAAHGWRAVPSTKVEQALDS